MTTTTTKEDETAAATAAKTSTTTTTSKQKKPWKTRKEMPSVAYMMRHGNPETAHLPKSKMEIYGYPVILAMIFAVSLLIFHYAPHSKSVQGGRKFNLPKQGGGGAGNMAPPQHQQHVKIPDETKPEGEL